MVDLCIILGVAVRVCSVSLFVQLLEKGGLISCHKFAQKCFSPNNNDITESKRSSCC